ncbi:DNA recombination protein RmuC [Austwickia chelonae]|uniref:DNA recombination protein RmuC n=1 Tax=Austwickia chelonae TaxID=100225 RepID=UPI000E255989|nr:DNA recombination protein RmuC [Austwickia chelonae]
MTGSPLGSFIALVCTAALGAVIAWLLATRRQAAQIAALTTERNILHEREAHYAERLAQVQSTVDEDNATAAALAPLRDAMLRVERQVGVLERDRVEQYGQVAERLAEVSTQTHALRRQTAGLAGALNSSQVRGAWGETQLRRVCEHSGMLPHCDFDEQVSAVSDHEATVRPDLLVRLPGERCLVVDAKAPLTAFLAAQADDLPGSRRSELLTDHAKALRAHVETLSAKRYWSAFSTSPEMVICFVPADAMLAAALSADPGLYDTAQSRKVVLASPATLLALLRSVAFAWRQDALATSARDLLALGEELYERLSTLHEHLSKMGGSLRRSVDHYNGLVGALEGRVFVTARRMHDMGLAGKPLAEVSPVEATPRPITAAELLSAQESGQAPEKPQGLPRLTSPDSPSAQRSTA